MRELTTAQEALLKLVSAFNGRYGAYSLEAAMKDLSGIPESDWTPIQDQLNTLENLGLIRPEVTEIGLSKYQITERGWKSVSRAG